jgi:hypothetical protein
MNKRSQHYPSCGEQGDTLERSHSKTIKNLNFARRTHGVSTDFLRGQGHATIPVLFSIPLHPEITNATKSLIRRNSLGVPSTQMMFHPESQSPPFSTAESKALEEARVQAIDTYLHGKRRPIANTPPADQAGSSRAQLQALLTHHRGSLRSSGALAGDEQTRRAEACRRDKALLIGWARNVGVLIGQAQHGEHRAHFLPIHRLGNGKFWNLGDAEEMAADFFQGRFAGLLPPKPADEKTRQMGHVLLDAMGVKIIRVPSGGAH